MAQADAQAAGARADPTGAEGARALREQITTTVAIAVRQGANSAGPQ